MQSPETSLSNLRADADQRLTAAAPRAAYLVVASVLVEQRYDGLNVSSLDDVEGLGALN